MTCRHNRWLEEVVVIWLSVNGQGRRRSSRLIVRSAKLKNVLPSDERAGRTIKICMSKYSSSKRSAL